MGNKGASAATINKWRQEQPGSKNVYMQHLITGYCKNNFNVSSMIIPAEIRQIILLFFDFEEESVDAIQLMKTGATFLRHDERGKPKYLSFHLTFDHKYLVWFDSSLSLEESRIRLKDIRQITIDIDSRIVEKTRNRDIIRASFTIYWLQHHITLTAKHEREAYIWCFALKTLSYAAKQGKQLRLLESHGSGKYYRSTKEVIDAIQSTFKIFPNKEIIKELLEYHVYLKETLQKSVDWIMSSRLGQFDKYKLMLESMDNRLREYKSNIADLNGNVDSNTVGFIKTDLFLCNADLLALNAKAAALLKR